MTGNQTATVSLEINGATMNFPLQTITQMGAKLEQARAEGIFPTTTAAGFDMQATVQDYLRLVQLENARGDAPRSEWNNMQNVVDLSIRIAQDIRTRDKVAGDLSETERVNAHVENMMSGVGAEAKLYQIVQHAVVHAVKNGTPEEAAAGQNMAELLNGIRGVIKNMAGQGTHGVHDVNIEAVVEEVFSTIDFALGQTLDGHAKQMNGQFNRVEGQINTVNGQIIHLNAIGQHVNAIDGHVHSLGNNLNSMGTLLNSTNGNITSMTAQVSLLQTIVNMLPRMITEILEQNLQQMLPEALHSALGPMMQAIESQLGIKKIFKI
ncbi:hypothetical protein F4819DRAFT_505624 [Hypoxylon fuscum]|nr:hypothetical protein F4819DRAFT_505624 [Hypoxylon fuscum]